jgi:acetyl-CoA synthetase
MKRYRKIMDMVRYSVTMEDALAGTIDRSAEKRGLSRSEWIREACTAYLGKDPDGALTGSTLLPSLQAERGRAEHNITDYDELYRNFSIDVPEYFNFGFDVIDAWAEKDRNRLAMVWVDQQGNEKKFTFRDLSRLSDRVVAMLIKYGVNKGDRVLIMLPRVPEWWICTIALIKRGAVYCPAPTMLTPKDLKYRITIAEIRMVITSREHADKVDEIAQECPSLSCKVVTDGERSGWISYPAELRCPAPASAGIAGMPGMEKTRSTDPLVIFFTSGTTGHPKMVLHDQSYALGHVVTARFWHDLRPSDLHFTISDTGWAKSAWGKFYGQWIEGSSIFVYDIRGRFNAAEIPPLIEKYGISTFCAPPTIYRMLILEDLKTYDVSGLRHCVSAGEPLNPEVIRAWKDATGLTIFEGYGQTETVLCIGTFPCMAPRPGSMGKPAPGWHIELHDDDGKPVGLREEGRIAVRLDPRPVGLFREYLNNPEANEKSFVKGFYYTDDMAYRDDDGYFWFIGRDDDVIKASGYRIGPFEVESALMEHPAVQEAAVVGSPDDVRGMIVKAFVILKPGFTSSDALIRGIQDHVKKITAPYKYPRAIEFVDSLPKTISGKIRRNELRDREMKKYHAGTNSVKKG